MNEEGKKEIDWIKVLREASHSGKNAILSNYGDIKRRREIVGRGVGGDLTLQIDKASESAIQRSLNSQLGEDSFVFVSEELGEVESKKKDGDDGRPKPVIICDPLDGSHNAEVGIPIFAVSLCVIGLNSVAAETKIKRTFSRVDAGFILSVPTSDEFHAMKNAGAFHNGKRLEPRKNVPKRIETLLVECGDADYLVSLTAKISNEYIYKTRILGSAAISFCLLANGTADGFLFAQPGGARTIDSPAGYLMARESGCVFAELSGKIDDVGGVEVGFDSRLSLIGASNNGVLSLLKSKVR